MRCKLPAKGCANSTEALEKFEKSRSIVNRFAYKAILQDPRANANKNAKEKTGRGVMNHPDRLNYVLVSKREEKRFDVTDADFPHQQVLSTAWSIRRRRYPDRRRR